MPVAQPQSSRGNQTDENGRPYRLYHVWRGLEDIHKYMAQKMLVTFVGPPLWLYSCLYHPHFLPLPSGRAYRALQRSLRAASTITEVRCRDTIFRRLIGLCAPGDGWHAHASISTLWPAVARCRPGLLDWGLESVHTWMNDHE